MPRISQLPALTAPEANDEIAIVDASAATTKKITRADLLKGAALPADTVDTQAIEDGAVTADKIDFSTLAYTNYTPSFSGWSANPSQVATRYVKLGTTCIVTVATNTGTSNAATTTISAPFTAATVSNARWIGTGAIVDNGAGQVGYLTIGSGESVFSVKKADNSNPAASGNKGVFGITIIYQTAS